MKKGMTLLLCLILAVGLCACGSEANRQQESENASSNTSEALTETGRKEAGTAEIETEEMQVEAEVSSESAEEAGMGKTLVVYFSASGNTKEAAEYIAAATNADMFELVPTEPYSDADLDWTDDDSRVVYEHENADARDIALVETAVSDWESYETVFVGYAGGIIGLN